MREAIFKYIKETYKIEPDHPFPRFPAILSGVMRITAGGLR